MTQRTWIAVVDATRARLFLHERELTPDGTRDELVEHEDLVDPARRLTTDELFSDTRSASSRAGGRHIGFDDHRRAHIDNMDEAFARQVSERIDQLLASSRSDRLVVCASPHMLGVLRRHVVRRDQLVITELPKDLVKLTRHELRARLADDNVLPHR